MHFLLPILLLSFAKRGLHAVLAVQFKFVILFRLCEDKLVDSNKWKSRKNCVTTQMFTIENNIEVSLRSRVEDVFIRDVQN